MHQNTKWLIEWSERMYRKYGNPDSDNDWCRKLAYSIGEEGNDHPSGAAIQRAMEWENNPPTNEA